MYKIIDFDYYGRGITKIDDKITFVKNALPDETVDIKVLSESKKYNEAEVTKYIKKSNKRVEVKCPYYNECGGCNIMHLSYLDQLKFKQDKIKNIITKYLSKDIVINDIVPSDSEYNYRNKISLKVDNKLGFCQDNTHKIIEIDKCLITDEKINDAIKYLNLLDFSMVSEIVCRYNNGLMIIIYTNNKNINIDCLKPVANSIYLCIDKNFIHVFGEEYIYEELDNYKYVISPDSFFQINKNITYKLYLKIKEYIKENENVLDLYCGTGSIGIFVNKGNKTLGIEINKNAIKNAKENKKINKLDNIDFILGDSGKQIKNLKFKPDTIIIDPPRSGLNKETINNIIKFKPNKIIYVSCNPISLVKDLKILSESFDIKEITPFDMFPNTHHVETVSVLCQKNIEK